MKILIQLSWTITHQFQTLHPWKLPEEVSQKRTRAFLVKYTGAMPLHQSAYKQGHSNETASNKIYNDQLLAVDHRKSSAFAISRLRLLPRIIDSCWLVCSIDIKVLTKQVSGCSYVYRTDPSTFVIPNRPQVCSSNGIQVDRFKVLCYLILSLRIRPGLIQLQSEVSVYLRIQTTLS